MNDRYFKIDNFVELLECVLKRFEDGHSEMSL